MSLTEVQVRPARPADLEAIVALERTTENAPHWPPAAYTAILEAQDPNPLAGSAQTAAFHRCLFVAQTAAEPRGPILGFAVGLTHHAEAVAELESVVVAASARRAGIGRALCAAVLDWCRSNGANSIVLEVRAASAAAIALYSGLGFARSGSRPRYYREPEDDALLLRLTLN